MKRLPLWPSSASKWIKCSGQPRIAAIANGFPREDNQFSAEGTLAHEYLHNCLTDENQPVDLPDDQKALLDEVAEEIKMYAQVGGFKLLSEQKFKLQFGKHCMNLIADIVLVNDNRLLVLDYKHGEGLAVDPHDNPQLLLYLSAVANSYPGRELEVGIIQPRGFGNGWTQIEVEQTELDSFIDTVTHAVKSAYAPEVEYVKGPHCQFCAGTKNPLCPAQLKAAIDATVESNLDGEDTTSWWLLEHLDGLKKVVKGVDEAADTWLKKGRVIEGWELEATEGRRKWYAPEEVPGALAETLGGKEEDYQTIKKIPMTLTEAMRVARKKKIDISGMIHRPTRLKRVRSENKKTIEMGAIE